MTSLSALRESDYTSSVDLARASATRRTLVDHRLKNLLPPADSVPNLLTDAVRDICLGPGKRVRPVLAMLSTAHFGGRELAALDFGCALELIHTASLVLDDLPCMDDAAMRRGMLTLHRRFGEDTAILSAVALLNHAYGVVTGDSTVDSGIRLALVALLSEAVGFRGLVAGQFRDLRDPEAQRDELTLASLNHQKTGVLFSAAMVGGAMIAGADEAEQGRARLFADHLGLAFQLWDDLQDLISTPEAVGKDVRKDDYRVTFITLWGEKRTRAAIAETIDEALESCGDRNCPLALYTLNLFHQAGYGG
ncbi:MAG TPA: polyprenyl synthetase family protein [Stellaceae bacterium]|jgi:geranylgeranyl diphosphate synthase type II|nr:polyprenyl synthetase family protein [Stellaceae bacterium]